jgi:hypothetical protein
MQDLRKITRYAAESAQEVLAIFERAHPADSRPRGAIDAALTFARGGERGKTLRDTAWAAHKAARTQRAFMMTRKKPQEKTRFFERHHEALAAACRSTTVAQPVGEAASTRSCASAG